MNPLKKKIEQNLHDMLGITLRAESWEGARRLPFVLLPLIRLE
jgi:hypothetical protein